MYIGKQSDEKRAILVFAPVSQMMYLHYTEYEKSPIYTPHDEVVWTLSKELFILAYIDMHRRMWA